jgi:hypothetical protein
MGSHQSAAMISDTSMTAARDRYERAARAAFEYAYPLGYGDKMRLSWSDLNLIAEGKKSSGFDTFKLSRAIGVVQLYRGIARVVIEA